MRSGAANFSRSRRRNQRRKGRTTLGLIFFLLLVLAIALTRTCHIMHWSGG